MDNTISKNAQKIIEEGKKIICQEKQELWESQILACQNDMTRSFGYLALEYIAMLDSRTNFSKVQEKFDAQNFSGLQASVVRNFIFLFADRGPEYWESTATEELTPEEREILEKQKEENYQMFVARDEKRGNKTL